MRAAAISLAALLAFGPVAALAVQPGEMLKDPRLEARARALSAELRCLVCQNQSVDDSDAPLARDIRLLVRERLQAGDDEARVRGFLVQRYGAFILLKPPFDAGTFLLWVAPFALLVLGAGTIARAARRRRVAGTPAPLSEAERADLDAILSKR